MVPALPMEDDSAFSGMAYEFQPEGATFTPSVSLSFTVLQARWGVDYSIKMFDGVSGRWQDVPSRYIPNTGSVTAEVSHFSCFALFTKTATPVPSASEPATISSQVAALPPPTALSTFSGIVVWVIDLAVKNIPVAIGVVILALALFLYRRKRRKDQILHLL